MSKRVIRKHALSLELFTQSTLTVQRQARQQRRPHLLGAACRTAVDSGRIDSVATLKGPAALALTAMVLAGCGGDDHRGTVEDTLQDSLNHLDPAMRGAFPVGAGPPRVEPNSCKRIPAVLPRGAVLIRPAPRIPKHLAFWSCVVRFAHIPFHLRVALKDNGEIFWAELMPRHVLRPGTATTYQGGPKGP